MRKIIGLGLLVVFVSAVLWVVNGGPTPAEGQGEKTYVGPSACKKCHFKEYKSWQAMKHAEAFASLPADKKADPECVKCHVTGYGEAGGYTSEADTPDMLNVSCEMCHGPGSEHAAFAKENKDKVKTDEAVKKELTSKIEKHLTNACIRCHNPHESHKEMK